MQPTGMEKLIWPLGFPKTCVRGFARRAFLLVCFLGLSVLAVAGMGVTPAPAATGRVRICAHVLPTAAERGLLRAMDAGRGESGLFTATPGIGPVPPLDLHSPAFASYLQRCQRAGERVGARVHLEFSRGDPILLKGQSGAAPLLQIEWIGN